MEHLRKALSPPGNCTIRSTNNTEKQPPPVLTRTNTSQSESADYASTTVLQPPPLHSSAQSIDPSPGHSRPASISHSVAHPQIPVDFVEPPNQAVTNNINRRASSFTAPLNPYAPTPIYPIAIQTLTMMIHFGILVVLGILLVEMKKTTAEFHTVSNNSTGSYFRVGLYGGGLGSPNRPFYTNQYNANATMGLSSGGWS